MNHDDIKRLFPNASASLLAANADGSKLPCADQIEGSGEREAVPDGSKLERSAGDAALGSGPKKEGNADRFLVRVTSRRRRLTDEDNLCEKYVVDCCRYAGFLPDDSPATTQIQVRQEKVREESEECTVIEIYTIQPADDAGTTKGNA